MEEFKDIPRESLPKHIGLILDGNRRWARSCNLDPNLGHLEGYKNLKDRLFDFYEAGIRYVTVYALSLENAKRRSPEELKNIYRIIVAAVDSVKNESIIRDEKIKINIIGRLHLLPQDVKLKLKELTDFTQDFDKAYLNVCIMYDGQEEIVDAIRKIVKDGVEPENINLTLVKNYLYTKGFPELDYIIRTGMEDGARLSGFLLWDASYSEFKFRDDYWPCYTREMVIEDLKEYIDRRRRKGA
ncbi:MAG: polyprenyl diphosphate synthase [Candidatus Heimdallarchaeota archaeon]